MEMAKRTSINFVLFNLLKYLIATNPDKDNIHQNVMIEAVKNTDARVKNNQSKTPGFPYSCTSMARASKRMCFN